MAKAERPVLLVGGIPGLDPREIMSTVAPVLGDTAIGLTDGEPAERRLWVIYLADSFWPGHPDIEMIRDSTGIDTGQLPEGFLPPDWPHPVPQGYHDLRWFRPRADVEKIGTDGITTGYPRFAIASYRIFCDLREQGVVPEGLRFQVCIPFPEDAVRVFTNDAKAMSAMVDAYIEIVRNDVAEITGGIPHDDLLLQWDVNWETVAVEHGDHLPDTPPMQFKPHGDPMDRYLRYVHELNAAVPETVPLGIHLCYGDLHHRHFKDPLDLRTSVEMANQAVGVSPRPIDYFHMAVPRNRSDDRYFRPLADLAIGDATVYAGLVHYTDGVKGSINRLDTLKRHYQGRIGVATECGLGRRPMDHDLIRLLEIHRDVAAAI